MGKEQPICMQVREEIVNPNIKQEINENIVSSRRYEKISNCSELLGHIVIGLTTLVAFAASYFDTVSELSFVAGCCSIFSLALLRFGLYAAKESSERHRLANMQLEKLGIEPMPPMTISDNPDGWEKREESTGNDEGMKNGDIRLQPASSCEIIAV